MRAGCPSIDSVELVAVRPDGRQATTEVGVAGCDERGRETGVSPRWVVHQADVGRPAGKVGVGLADERADPLDQAVAGTAEPLARLAEPGVPYVERGRCIRIESSRHLSQQRVALAHDAIQFESRRVVLHRQRDKGVVEVPTAVGGTALDQREVVRREHRHPDDTEQIAGAFEPLPVDLHAVAAGRHQLGLDQRGPSVVVTHLGTQDRRRAARPHERLGRRATEAGQRRQIRQRLGEVGLAVAVVAHHDRGARRQLERRRAVVAVVGEVEPFDDHGRPHRLGIRGPAPA